MADDGRDKVGRFAPGKVDSVRFAATGGEGDHIGLNEIEAWDDTNPYEYLLDRSRNWRNLYDRPTGFTRPKGPDGQCMEPFDPLSPAHFLDAS